MSINLVEKKDLADILGVDKSAVSKMISRGKLSASIVDGKVNLAHPQVIAIVNKKNGVDPLHEEAAAAMIETGRHSARFLQEKFKIGHTRAKRLLGTLKSQGRLSGPEPVPVAKPEPPPEPPAPVYVPIADRPTIANNGSVKGDNSSAKKGARAKRLGIELPTGDAYTELEKLVVEKMLALAVPEDIREFAHLPLIELVKKFGTDTRFSEWLKASKLIEDVAEKRIKNSKSEGDLVSRDLIKTGVIDHVEKAHMQILTDGCKTMTKRLTAMHDAGRDALDCEKSMRETITSFIRPMKSKIAKGLREA